MQKNGINVAIAIDDGYVKYAYVMLTSLFENNDGVTVFILQNNLKQESRVILAELAKKYNNEIEFIEVEIDDETKKLLPLNAWKIQTYYRLFLVDALLENLERIIYLDSDMIITGSLRKLYNIELGKNVIAAYANPKPDEKISERRADIFRELYADRAYGYFNAGFLLCDLKKMRGRYNFKYYMDALGKLEYKVYTPDQDILNVVHYDEVLLIDEIYNFEVCSWYEKDYEEKKDAIKVLHYILEKPWQANHTPFFAEGVWWNWAKKTPFYEEFRDNYISGADSLIEYKKKINDIKGRIADNTANLKESLDIYLGVLDIYEKLMKTQWEEKYSNEAITAFDEKMLSGREIFTYYELLGRYLDALNEAVFKWYDMSEKFRKITKLDELV